MENIDRHYRWYSVELLDAKRKPKTYVFRGLTRAELRLAGTKKDGGQAETYILNTCVQGKYDWDNMLLGVVRKLLDEIYKASGITENATVFKEALAWIKDPQGVLEAAAVSMVAGCTLNILDNCDPSHYAKYCILGKWNFETMFGIELEVAFGLKEAKQDTGDPDFVNVSRASTGPVAPGQGEVGRQVEQFTWKKPK